MNKMTKQRTKNYILAVASLACLILLFFYCLSVNAAAESQSFGLERIVFDSSAQYLYLDSPTAIDVGANGILIADFDGSVAIYNKSSLEKTHEFLSTTTPSSIALMDNTAIFVDSGNIIFQNNQKRQTLEGDFYFVSLSSDSGVLHAVSSTDILSFDASLIVLNGKQSITANDYLLAKSELPSNLASQISAFCVDNNVAYFAATSTSNKNFDDIYSLDLELGSLKKIYERSRKANGMAFLADRLYLSTASEIVCYQIIDSNLSHFQQLDFDAIAISAHGGQIYALTSDNALFSLSSSLDAVLPVFLSQSQRVGFFSSPSYAYTRRGNIFVADTFGDRLFVAGEAGLSTADGYERISSVVSSNVGNIFVSYGINKIAKLSSELTVLDYIEVPRSIKKLIIDTSNNVFVQTSQELFVLSDALELTKLGNYPSIVDLCFVMGSQTLIYYDGTAVYKAASPLLAGSLHTKLFEKANIKSITADLVGNIFFFDNDGLMQKYDATDGNIYELALDSSVAKELKHASSITLSNVKNQFVDYGDLIFASPLRHLIFRLASDVVGAVITSGNHVNPNIAERVPVANDVPIVFRLKTAAELFSSPIEIGGGRIIAKDSRVFYFDEYNSFEEFAFVIYEDIVTKNLVAGYIFRNLIDFTHYDFSSPPITNAIVYFDNTPIYKFPSVHSTILKYYDKNTDVALSDFAAPIAEGSEYSTGIYIDNYGRTWYRIASTDGTSGFIQTDYLSINKYVPALRPKTNATIIAYEGNAYADLYYFDEEEQSYIRIQDELPLAEGTRVEIIVTPLNPQNEYTEIRFYREGLGTLTCFVKTQHIKYDTVTSIQIVAIAALIITLVLASILIIWLLKTKVFGKNNGIGK